MHAGLDTAMLFIIHIVICAHCPAPYKDCFLIMPNLILILNAQMQAKICLSTETRRNLHQLLGTFAALPLLASMVEMYMPWALSFCWVPSNRKPYFAGHH